jgi:hypothetical protein
MEHKLRCRPDVGFQKMSSHRRAVAAYAAQELLKSRIAPSALPANSEVPA